MIDGIWLVLRAAGFILLLQASGAVLFLALFAQELPAAAVRVIRARAARIALASLLCVIAQALVEPMHLAGEWQGAKDPALWGLTLAAPGAWIFWPRCAGLLVIVPALWRGRAALPVLALPAAVLALGSFLISGHALLDTHRLLLAPLLALHVLTVAFWFGALTPLHQVAQRESPPVAAAVLRRFSVYASWLVPLLGVAGVAMACLLLPDLAALTRPYGAILCLKALLFVTLLALAARNKLALVPALSRAEAPARAALLRNLVLEYLLVAAVLIATAAMTGLFSPAAGAT